MKKTYNTARQALFLDHQPDEALALLNPLRNEENVRQNTEDARTVYELIGLAQEDRRGYDEGTAAFLAIEDFYQAGYCQLLKGDIIAAGSHWQHLLAIRQNHWCITLFGLVRGKLESFPTFLQIRNHLEADIINLWRAGQTQLAQNIILHTEFLSNINYEAYKFAGRALFHVGQLDDAGKFLIKGQKILPNDAEAYYHLGQYYAATGQRKEALLVLQQCLLISASYTPAEKLRQSLLGA